MCGGTLLATTEERLGNGLSPRVRGNRSAGGCSASSRGTIPACAGEPRRSGRPPRAGWDYPRVCGGTTAAGMAALLRRGLSPRVRGNRGGADAARSRLGTIPACAGEPTAASRVGKAARDYPRVCGGTDEPTPQRRIRWGLSPRVRGNRQHGQASGRENGTIPACAGEPRTR